jgi:hypothetical protein
LEFRLPLPPFKERSTDWKKHPQKEILEETYASLFEKVTVHFSSLEIVFFL